MRKIYHYHSIHSYIQFQKLYSNRTLSIISNTYICKSFNRNPQLLLRPFHSKSHSLINNMSSQSSAVTKVDSWNPSVYAGRFVNERTRPGIELLERALSAVNQSNQLTNMKRIYDLGCGTGRFIPYIMKSFPELQELVGLDMSDTMLSTATIEVRKELSNDELFKKVSFTKSAIETLKCSPPADLLYSNAALQWLPNHSTLIPHLLSQLRSGGVLAIQVPNNFTEPSHTLYYEIGNEMESQGLIPNGTVASLHDRGAAVLPTLGDYYKILYPLCSYVDVWDTIYYHTFTSPLTTHPIAHFLMGSSLAAFLAEFPKQGHEYFLKEYIRRCKEVYPVWIEKNDAGEEIYACMFPFSRWFMVATKK